MCIKRIEKKNKRIHKFKLGTYNFSTVKRKIIFIKETKQTCINDNHFLRNHKQAKRPVYPKSDSRKLKMNQKRNKKRRQTTYLAPSQERFEDRPDVIRLENSFLKIEFVIIIVFVSVRLYSHLRRPSMIVVGRVLLSRRKPRNIVGLLLRGASIPSFNK